VHADRALNALGDAIHALGPAAVLAYGVDGGPRPADWPWYVLALVALILCDTLAGLGRAWAAHGVRPPLQARALAGVYALDVLLAPVGLLAAFASEESPYAFLLGTPLVWLLAGYAREREARLTSAIEVGEHRERVLEAELEAAQAHADVLGAVSHGLQTPLAGLIGLSRLLEQHDGELPAERRAELGGALVGHAEDLRHVVRQTLDFQVLRAAGTPHVDLVTVALAPLVREVATRVCDGRRPVGVDVADDLPAVRADPARVRQILTSLLDNACRHTPPGTAVVVAVRRQGDRVAVDVIDGGSGVPVAVRDGLFERPVSGRDGDGAAGTGLGLYVGRALARVMGGDLEPARAQGHDGAGFVLSLPCAPMR
jgi:two-component system sensor histidine kinase KdpD